MSVVVDVDQFVAASGGRGVTLESTAHGLGYTPQQVGCAMNELASKGRIVRTAIARDDGLLGQSPVFVSDVTNRKWQARQ